MATYNVGYFVGSLASTSINRLLAKALVRLAPSELVLSEIPICSAPAERNSRSPRTCPASLRC